MASVPMQIRGGDSSSGTSDLASLRAKPRLKTFQPTTMRIGAAKLRVHILDLSASGALVHHASPPPTATIVRIACAGRELSAQVMWRDGERFGLRFLLSLSDEQLARAVSG